MTYRGRQAWHARQRATSHARLTASLPTMASPGEVAGRDLSSALVLSQHRTGLEGAQSGSINATFSTCFPPPTRPLGEENHRINCRRNDNSAVCAKKGPGKSGSRNTGVVQRVAALKAVPEFYHWAKKPILRHPGATPSELAGAQVPAVFHGARA